MAQKLGIEVNQARLRLIFGMSISTLNEKKKRGLPYKVANVGGHNLIFNTEEVSKWLINDAIAQATKSNAPSASNLDAARARLATVQADRVEAELQKTHGELIPVDQVIEAWGTRIINFRAKMLSLPAKTARILAAIDDYKDIARVLRDEIDEALNELVREELEASAAEGEGDDDQASAPAAEADAEPVGEPEPIPQRGRQRGAGKVPQRSGAVSSGADGRDKRSGHRAGGHNVGKSAPQDHMSKSSDRVLHRPRPITDPEHPTDAGDGGHVQPRQAGAHDKRHPLPKRKGKESSQQG